MKYLFGFLLSLFSLPVFSQMTLIAEDESPYPADGYAQGYKVDSAQGIDGLTFFTTPNFRLYQTDGTKAGTKVLYTFQANSLVYLKGVTRRFIYYTQFQQEQHQLNRINRQTLKSERVMTGQNPVVMEIGYSAMYMHPKRDMVAVRLYKSEINFTGLIALPDTAVADGQTITGSFKKDESAEISLFSQVGFIGRQLFYSGWVKGTFDGKEEKETTIASAVPGITNTGREWVNHSYYKVRGNGVELNGNFSQIGDSLFSLGFYNDKATGRRKLALMSISWDMLRVPYLTETDEQYAYETVIGDEIYIHNGGRLLMWKPGMNAIEEVFRKKGYQYLELRPFKGLMKVRNHLVYRVDDGTMLYDMRAKAITNLNGPLNVRSRNSLYSEMNNYLFTTDNYLYYLNEYGVYAFKRYDPDTKQTVEFTFPEFKKETFATVNAIHQTGNRFIFLTTYRGKKDKPVYRVFSFEG